MDEVNWSGLTNKQLQSMAQGQAPPGMNITMTPAIQERAMKLVEDNGLLTGTMATSEVSTGTTSEAAVTATPIRASKDVAATGGSRIRDST